MEIEYKYRIDSEEQANAIFDDEDVKGIMDENSQEIIDLHAIYFDTEDRRLGREGITFRTRREGERYVATVKWNGSGENGLHVREEINIPLDSDEIFKNPTVDVFAQSQMCDVIKKTVGARTLLPRVEVKVTRRQARIDTGKSICEISYDKGKVINGDKEGVISEMEIELYSGSREDMEEFSEKLSKKHDLSTENRSKFRQGLELNQE